MTSRSLRLHRGALTGLALLLAGPLTADDTLRDEIHRQYKHQSYMLVEDTDGARLFLFGESGTAIQLADRSLAIPHWVNAAFDKLRSPDPKARVRGLTELAGVDAPAALDAALTMLTDASPAVRDEAEQLILDHPGGGAVATALGLIDEDLEE